MMALQEAMQILPTYKAAVLLGVTGIAAGSFASVLCTRPVKLFAQPPAKGRDLPPSLLGRSQCDVCGKAISAHLNVPVLSWLMLRGRSRCCGSNISAGYPIIEIFGGCSLAAVAILPSGNLHQGTIAAIFATIALGALLFRATPNLWPWSFAVLTGGALMLLGIIPSSWLAQPEIALAASAAMIAAAFTGALPAALFTATVLVWAGPVGIPAALGYAAFQCPYVARKVRHPALMGAVFSFVYALAFAALAWSLTCD